jgi:YD repeat-containing protein
MLVGLIVLAIVFASVACLWNQGLWTAILLLFNVMTAALLATILFEPVANAFSTSRGNYADFIALWGLFIFFMGLMRLATDLVSRRNVKFIWPVDIAGAIFFALCTGWILACFTVTSLHVAPLARSPLGGSFMPSPEVDDRMFGIGPDRIWLAFIQNLSQGGLRREEYDEADAPVHVFDPDGNFIYKYAARRRLTEGADD